MLTPDFLRDITKKTEKAVEKFNNAMIKRIVERIIKLFTTDGKIEIIPSSVLDVKKIKESGKVYEDIVEEVAKYTPGIEAEVKKAFEDVERQINSDNAKTTAEIFNVGIEDKNVNTKDTGKDTKDTGKDTEKAPQKETETEEETVTEAEVEQAGTLTPKEKKLLERAYEATNGEIYNLTGTTAQAWQKTYIEACDNAYWKATHGVSMAQAVKEAIDEVSKTGSHVIYPSGHTDTIEVAIARAVRTGVAQAAGDIALTRCAEIGADHVLVSSHLGARTTPNTEPANHASWQGKVYKLDWDNEALAKYKPTAAEEEEAEKKGFGGIFNKLKKKFKNLFKKKYPDFTTTTGYGTGAGLCGWNCRHHFSAFFPGINTNNQKQYDSEENQKAYDLSQKQRAMERAIRKTKRRLNAAKHTMKQASDYGESLEAQMQVDSLQEKLDQQQDAYTQFCAENNLKREEDRLYVASEYGES